MKVVGNSLGPSGPTEVYEQDFKPNILQLRNPLRAGLRFRVAAEVFRFPYLNMFSIMTG